MIDLELQAFLKEVNERGGILLEEFAAMTAAERDAILPDLIAMRDCQEQILRSIDAVRQAESVFNEEDGDGKA